VKGQQVGSKANKLRATKRKPESMLTSTTKRNTTSMMKLTATNAVHALVYSAGIKNGSG